VENIYAFKTYLRLNLNRTEGGVMNEIQQRLKEVLRYDFVNAGYWGSDGHDISDLIEDAIAALAERDKIIEKLTVQKEGVK
jgi:hypothetical protein